MKSYICVLLTLTLVCELTPSSGLPLCQAESENRSTNRPLHMTVLPGMVYVAITSLFKLHLTAAYVVAEIVA